MNWISVTQQLPQPSKQYDGKTKDWGLNKVLVYSPTTIGITTAFYWGMVNESDPMAGWSLMGVTHWMPLPDLPGKEIKPVHINTNLEGPKHRY